VVVETTPLVVGSSGGGSYVRLGPGLRRGARPPVAARHAAAPAQRSIRSISRSLAMISFRPVPVGGTGTGAAPARDAFLFSVAPTLQGIKAASRAAGRCIARPALVLPACSASFYPFHRRDACKGLWSVSGLDGRGKPCQLRPPSVRFHWTTGGNDLIAIPAAACLGKPFCLLIDFGAERALRGAAVGFRALASHDRLAVSAPGLHFACRSVQWCCTCRFPESERASERGCVADFIAFACVPWSKRHCFKLNLLRRAHASTYWRVPSKCSVPVCCYIYLSLSLSLYLSLSACRFTLSSKLCPRGNLSVLTSSPVLFTIHPSMINYAVSTVYVAIKLVRRIIVSLIHSPQAWW
jgi:hypothetical protein